MITYPNAKINIGLNITERRADGYHNLETIFYPVKIYDALEVIVSDELSFTSSGQEIPGRMEDNLCIKGYHLLKEDFDLPPVAKGRETNASTQKQLLSLLNRKKLLTQGSKADRACASARPAQNLRHPLSIPLPTTDTRTGRRDPSRQQGCNDSASTRTYLGRYM